MKKIVMTGGGTAGHVTPNIALMPSLKEAGFEIFYIGSYDGIEKGLIEKIGIPYYGVSTGKLRRYMDIRNFSDPFRVLKGIREAKKILKEIEPDVVFSKGGFVSVPVVKAAASLKNPISLPDLPTRSVFPWPRPYAVISPRQWKCFPKVKECLPVHP